MAGCGLINDSCRARRVSEGLYRNPRLRVGLCALVCAAFWVRQRPADWGSDHVGKPLPEFATGDECLFCHRTDIGPFWGDNRHNRSLRPAEPEAPALKAIAQFKGADEVTLILGDRNRQRFLKPAAAYGQLDIFSAEWDSKKTRLVNTDNPHWDAHNFGDSCAGCHTTAVDSSKRSFAALSLDCYVCHGDVPAKHAKDTTQVYLAKNRQDSARVVTSICAQCHVRTGKSKSSGLSYPNNFVAGDNLFRDFQVDLSDKQIAGLNPGDRHVLENVRDVVLLGKVEVTCLSCHEVHKQSAKRHHRLAQADTCLTCHPANASKKERIPYEVHSTTCGY
jgi:hypothetical protein